MSNRQVADKRAAWLPPRLKSLATRLMLKTASFRIDRNMCRTAGQIDDQADPFRARAQSPMRRLNGLGMREGDAVHPGTRTADGASER